MMRYCSILPPQPHEPILSLQYFYRLIAWVQEKQTDFPQNFGCVSILLEEKMIRKWFQELRSLDGYGYGQEGQVYVT
ncbi:hypothetical protein HMPREF2557_00075 [Neisseria sp. HMSC064F03]|nr:hypothetical protein HMPREF2675_05230 [Neisseria sp. HMSC061H08]OHQ18361.1 hypothetical protein HMPREF2557_00075 [Neisseria sp. HMSC064F03]